MNARELLDGILLKLKNKGADKVALNFSAESTEEFNVIYQELNLLRSVETNSIGIIVIKDQKQASTRLNQFDDDSIDKAAQEVMQAVENSNPDPAFDISPRDEGSWTDGELRPDVDKVVLRLQEFIRQTKERYPELLFDATLSHDKSYSAHLNSNGAWFEHHEGVYGFNALFTAKKDGKMSSLNYTGFALGDLDRELLDINFTGEYFRQSTEQIVTHPVTANFTGEVIISPILAMQLVYTFIQSQIGDGGLLMKSSKYPDHLGQQILDPKFTLLSDPQHPELCNRKHYSTDGFRTTADPIIGNGVLRHYPISLYTANKCGKERTIGPPVNLILQSGPDSLKDMIGSVKQGILCLRASFGNPNANGDFSGVVKNSYYIKDGAISHPISETMLNANLIEMLKNIVTLSSETFNSGGGIFPYLQIRDVYISKK